MSRYKEIGVTAIELLITLSIVIIVTTLAVPGFTSTFAKYQLSSDHNTLIADLNLARSEAIRRNAPVSICQSNNQTSCTATGWGGGRIVFLDNSTAGVVDAGDTILRVSAPISTRNTMTADFAGTFIQYAPAGISNVSGAVTTCRSGYPGLQATIQPIGRIGTIKLTGLCS